MKKLMLLLVSLGGFACVQAKVSAVCVPNDKGFQCTLAEVKGSKKVHACFDLQVKCDNGTKPTVANICEDVTKDKPAVHNVAFSEFKDGDKCDKPTKDSTTLSNMKVTE